MFALHSKTKQLVRCIRRAFFDLLLLAAAVRPVQPAMALHGCSPAVQDALGFDPRAPRVTLRPGSNGAPVLLYQYGALPRPNLSSHDLPTALRLAQGFMAQGAPLQGCNNREAPQTPRTPRSKVRGNAHCIKDCLLHTCGESLAAQKRMPPHPSGAKRSYTSIALPTSVFDARYEHG